MPDKGILDFYPVRRAVVGSVESLKTFEKGGYMCLYVKKVSDKCVKDGEQS